MSDQVELPKAEIATKDWTLKELMDTERRFEKAFRDQTVYIGQKFDGQNRWMFGMMVSIVASIVLTLCTLIAAVYFK